MSSILPPSPHPDDDDGEEEKITKKEEVKTKIYCFKNMDQGYSILASHTCNSRVHYQDYSILASHMWYTLHFLSSQTLTLEIARRVITYPLSPVY